MSSNTERDVLFIRLSEIMSNNLIPSLVNLPVHLVYHILDQLDPLDILLSVRDMCTRMNRITDVYRPYQVNFTIFDELHTDDDRDTCVSMIDVQ